ncbi:MAG: hypothetical protein R3A47_10655 [Polyangiales bacterium]
MIQNDDSELHVLADRVIAKPSEHDRVVEAFEAAMHRGHGKATAWLKTGDKNVFSRGLHCAQCNLDFRDPTPGLFSFNNPVGAYDSCRGFGRTIEVDFDKVLPDDSLSLDDGAIAAWTGKATQWERRELRKHAAKAGIPSMYRCAISARRNING